MNGSYFNSDGSHPITLDSRTQYLNSEMEDKEKNY